MTVPDGGTVLLGGVKTMNEHRTEYGVPVLSKTPLLDRLFRNVGIGRVTTSLMLMVTPRIIILEEEEEKLGIPVSRPLILLGSNRTGRSELLSGNPTRAAGNDSGGLLCCARASATVIDSLHRPPRRSRA